MRNHQYLLWPFLVFMHKGNIASNELERLTVAPPMQRLVWHSGQWYLVFLRRILPLPSVVFQQKLQERAGPSLAWKSSWRGSFPKSHLGTVAELFHCRWGRSTCKMPRAHHWSQLSTNKNYWHTRHLLIFTLRHVYLQWRLMAPRILIDWIASAMGWSLSESAYSMMMVAQDSQTGGAFWSWLHVL